MATPPKTRDAVTRLIREHGPMTIAELAEELGKPKKTVNSCVSSARAGKVKHFYIKDWRRQVGRSGLPAAIFALGNRRDAPYPGADKKTTDRRSYEKHKAIIKLRRSTRAASPFKTMISQLVTA
ncbi:hypothetical protein [Paraburkholderia tropica]|uniref:hypothetical protein n=1 Tax=Paraburkholderia tropica TaxID=92647 RepID=UPI002AB77BC0|nr:hypothetical protein [Paraburkholderia tropica]